MRLRHYYESGNQFNSKQFVARQTIRLHRFDREQFRQNLAETIAWCQPRIDIENPKSCLRSSELRPDKGKSQFPSYPDFTESLVNRLIETRRRRLQDTLLERSHKFPGNLLFYFPDNNLDEGALAVESHGYLLEDMPPWDTIINWVTIRFGRGRFGNGVIFWLPEEYRTLASDALWTQSADWLWLIESAMPRLFPR